MKFANLGRSGVKTSRLVLGTMNFGPHTDEKDAAVILDHAVEAGINFIDTADVYGGPGRQGWTEEIVGRWLKDSGQRDNIVLATKVYGKMAEGVNDRGLSAFHIRRAVEASLRRLQADHIDLYQLHHIDRETPWEEVWQALDILIAQGKITYAGSSNFAGWHLAQAAETARQRCSVGLVSEQSLYNLRSRAIELEVLPAAQHYGLGVLAWSPLAAGTLSTGPGIRRAEGWGGDDTASAERLRLWFELCSSLNHKPGQIALAWLLHRPGVHGPVVGPRTLDQLHSAVAAADIELDRETLVKIDEIFPGPGGAAPEAYAW